MQSLNFQGDKTQSDDVVEVGLKKGSQYIIAIIFGLLPLLFIPISFLPIDYGKILFVIAGVLVAIIFFSLSTLRSGKVNIALPAPLYAFWGIAGITLLSAILSGDMRDAILGDVIEVQTALFVLVLAIIVTSMSILEQTKASIMRLYVFLTASSAILAIYHVARLVFGASFLSLGMFSGSVDTPVGGWNDLALFLGLSIILSLIALEQLHLTKWGRIIFSAGVVLALGVLAVINFFAVWVVLTLVSLAMLMYGLTKDRFAEKTISMESKTPTSSQSVFFSMGVFLVSLLFVIGGSWVGGLISNAVNISYVEVRPSFSATIDVARGAYNENAFLGIGPNKFVDAWRMYKDQSINQTIFWATDFRGGSGYIPTLFVTTGIFGIIAWLVFIVLFLIMGFKMLFKTTYADRFWYFIGSSSFVAALYLWGMSFVYVPGATILLLAALFTSITFVAYSTLIGTKTFTVSVSQNRRSGVALIICVMLIIVGSSSALYYVGTQFSGVYTYGKTLTSINENTQLAEVEQGISDAYALFPNDAYARQMATFQLNKMNALINLPDATAEQQQEFVTAMQNGVNAAKLAVDTDATDPLNWSVYGAIYSVLSVAGVEGAKDLSKEAYAKARALDPVNPTYALLEAQLYSRTGDLASSRTAAQESVRLKTNYTDALFFLTQLDIAEGNTEAAIATTQSIVSIEPNNPARFYQLGILYASAQDMEAAAAAFERAVALDGNYANARYFLAVTYAQLEQKDKALEQLNVVLELNPGNQEVITLMNQIQSDTFEIATESPIPEQITEPELVSENEDGVVTTTEASDTPLVTPVNTVGSTDEEAEVGSE